MKLIKFFLLIMASSCTLFTDECPTGIVFNNYEKKVKRSDGLEVSGIGSMMPTGNLCGVFMSFRCFHPMSLPEARKLFVKLSEGLLAETNSTPQIRPYMEVYPFTAKNIELGLAFVDKKGDHLMDGNLAYILYIKDSIAYTTLADEKSPFKVIYKEPYEQAVKIVRGEIPDPYVAP